VTHPVDHLDDDLLSAIVDDQLTPNERSQVQAHLETCSACQERLEEFRSVAGLLQRLPDLPPPRDFSLGPRLLVDPPNVIRLRRWYTATRVAAGSLAAVFVLLSVGTLYVDSRPTSTSREIAVVARPQVASAPAPQDAQPAPAAAPTSAPAVKAAAPAAAPAAAGAARPAGANPEPLDQQAAAATSQRSLPTPAPTPQPTVFSVVPPSPPALTTSAAVDSAAPLRTAAILVGVLAVLTLLATLMVRHRLRQSAPHF